MPKDVTEQFCADPEGFMDGNVVLQKIANDTPAGVIGVRMYAGNAKIDNKPSGMVCYTVLANRGQTPSLPAYWCPYEQNALKSAMLGDDALFAFTPTMNGCSVGLGSSTGSGAQMMSHSNAGAIGAEWESEGLGVARARQSQSQHNQLRFKLGNSALILGPEDYRPNAVMESTTFAVHALGRPWTLNTLTYRRTGRATYQHGGVTEYR